MHLHLYARPACLISCVTQHHVMLKRLLPPSPSLVCEITFWLSYPPCKLIFLLVLPVSVLCLITSECPRSLLSLVKTSWIVTKMSANSWRCMVSRLLQNCQHPEQGTHGSLFFVSLFNSSKSIATCTLPLRQADLKKVISNLVVSLRQFQASKESIYF